MSDVDELTRIIMSGLGGTELPERTRTALDSLFGERYHSRFRSRTGHSIRTAFIPGDDAVPFAGLVPEESASSGVYGGMSLIWFPVLDKETNMGTSLLTFVCGTRGLTPDEQILGRPGHARLMRAMRRHLSSAADVSVWTKHDPSSLNQPIPEVVRKQYPKFDSVFRRYGNFIYSAVEVPRDFAQARKVVMAFLDLYAMEREWTPIGKAAKEVEQFRSDLLATIFERHDRAAVLRLLRERRFVILSGPPGTGKTRMALEILAGDFGGSGKTVQFHPAITYENFIVGISPSVREESLAFAVSPGWLASAIRQAREKDFLLHIDEINRADLGKVLGEAIYLFEPREIAEGNRRKVELPFPIEGDASLDIPNGLFVLGTMNSADRSIAILDMAVRRRFAFVNIWPDSAVIREQEITLATQAFERLLEIFVQFVPDAELVLLPGHSYFLARSDQEVVDRLKFELIPLLTEYLEEGRLAVCEGEIRAYVDWLEGKIATNGT